MKQNILRNALMLTVFAGVLNAKAQSIPEAIALTESERFERSGSILRGLLQTNATDGEAWFYLGENYFENARIPPPIATTRV